MVSFRGHANLAQGKGQRFGFVTTVDINDAAALGFLGMGAQPPTPEWGTMLAEAREFILRAWWVVTLPGCAILTTVLAINLMGDGLRDILDPRLRLWRAV